MAPRVRAAGGFAGMVGSDSEPDFDSIDTAGAGAARSPVRQSAPAKKPRGRPPTSNRVTKPVAKSSRGVAATAAQRPARQALKEKINTKSSRDPITAKTESLELDEIRIADQGGAKGADVAKPKRGRPKVLKETKSASTTATEPAENRRVEKRGRPSAKNVSSPEDEIPETQDAMDVDSDTPEHLTDVDEPLSTDVEMDSRSKLPEFDMEDASIRRRLGELTTKYESLEARHRDLREVGIKAAERNFERLRRQAEENTMSSNKLISQLKEEVAAQTALARQGERLREELVRSEATAAGLQAKVTGLNDSLTDARCELKTLSARLASSRSAETIAKVPGSALKAGSAQSRAAQSELAYATQAKEDLYGDLTGLIVRGVSRENKETIFDCIQAGRNGTLHFKLALESSDASSSYEDVQLTYRPQLDLDRDCDLMEVLPDYLIEEITFPRPHASKFYNRVTKSLTERVD